MLKTNSIKFKENLKNYIMCSYENSEEYYTWNGREMSKDYKSICADILGAFRKEKAVKETIARYRAIGRYITEYSIFKDWMQGLPSAFDGDYYYHCTAVKILGDMLEETETERERFTEDKAEELLTLHLYNALLRGENGKNY